VGRWGIGALIDAHDADYGRAVQVVRQIAVARRPSFITNYIEVEAHALLLRKLGRMLAREWLLTGGLAVVRALPAEEDRAREIIARHSDKNWSLCYAISFAVLEARGIRRAFTFESPLPTVQPDRSVGVGGVMSPQSL
jgi:predicted nucleic acid-binding protein